MNKNSRSDQIKQHKSVVYLNQFYETKTVTISQSTYVHVCTIGKSISRGKECHKFQLHSTFHGCTCMYMYGKPNAHTNPSTRTMLATAAAAAAATAVEVGEGE